jgi:hypothetical protein
MNKRQRYALLHPLGRASAPLSELRALSADRRHATGLLLRSILAVDR